MVTTATVQWPRAWCGLRTVPTGVDPDAPACLYLVGHDARGVLGVGVTGAQTNRLDHLESLGWRVVQCWWFDLGFDALEVEEGLIDRWRNLFSLRPWLDLDDLLENGSTTAIAASWGTELDATEFADRQCRSLAQVSDVRDPWPVAS